MQGQFHWCIADAARDKASRRVLNLHKHQLAVHCKSGELYRRHCVSVQAPPFPRLALSCPTLREGPRSRPSAARAVPGSSCTEVIVYSCTCRRCSADPNRSIVQDQTTHRLGVLTACAPSERSTLLSSLNLFR